MMRWLSSLAVVLSLGCGPQNVTPLDPRDPSLPDQTRQWVADVADGVIAARTRRDAAERALTDAVADRARLTEGMRFTASGGNDPTGALRLMMEARVTLAELRLEHANARVALARQSERLTNAEQSIRHGRGRYDLTPIERAHEAELQRVQSLAAELRDVQSRAHERTQEWWSAYHAYVQAGGETLPYWTSLSDSAAIGSTTVDDVDSGEPVQATDDELPPMFQSGGE